MASDIAHLGEPGVPCREGGSSTIWLGEPRPMLLGASDWRLRSARAAVSWWTYRCLCARRIHRGADRTGSSRRTIRL